MLKIIQQALEAKFGSIEDSSLINNLMEIIRYVDNDENNHVVAHMLLGVYEKPNIPLFLCNKKDGKCGVVADYNPITDKVTIEYDYPLSDTWYYPTKEDMDNNTNGTTDWSVRRNWKDYVSKEIPNGKTSIRRDEIYWSRLASSNWDLYSNQEEPDKNVGCDL